MKSATTSSVLHSKVSKPQIVRTKPVVRSKGLSKAQRAQVQKLVRLHSEVKFFDTNISNQNVDNDPNILLLSSVPQGVTDITRVGSRMKALALRLNLTFTTSGSTNQTPGQSVRLALFSYKQNNALAPPSIGTFFAREAGYVAEEQYNFENSKLYKVLHDQVITLVQAGSNARQNVSVRIPIPQSVQDIEFTGSTINATNHIYMALFTNSTAIANFATYQGTIRLLFSDS